MVSHSECQLEHSPLNSETSSHLAIEPETSVRSNVNELSVDEAEQNNSVDSESDDSQFRKHLLIFQNRTLNHQTFVQIVTKKGNSKSAQDADLPDIAPRSATGNCVKQFSHFPD